MKDKRMTVLFGKSMGYESPVCEIMRLQCEKGLCVSPGGVGADDLEDGGTVGFW